MDQHTGAPGDAADLTDVDARLQYLTGTAYLYATVILLTLGLGVAAIMLDKLVLLGVAGLVVFVGMLALAFRSGKGRRI